MVPIFIINAFPSFRELEGYSLSFLQIIFIGTKMQDER